MGLAHASPIIDPQIKPSNQTLKPDPQKLSLKTGQPLKLDPQKLWQTLKKFDYPLIFLKEMSLVALPSITLKSKTLST